MRLQYFLRPGIPYRVLMGALSFSTLWLWACSGGKETSQEAPPAYKVSVQPVASHTGSAQFEYSGNLEADNAVNLAFSVSGRVVTVKVEEGAHVSKGALLASIETTRYQSAFEIANAAYTKAADQFKRSDELYARGSLPERDYIAAKAELAQAKANKDLAAKDLADTRLVAPFSGVVTKKITELGALTAPGNPAFTLTKTDVMYATAAIAEGDIAQVTTGDSVVVVIPALHEQRRGVVSILNPQADSYSRTFEVKVRLQNDDGKILPGMVGRLQIYTREPQQLITIPTSCILKDVDNIAYVFLAQPNHTAIKRRIAITNATGMNQVIVSSGLKEGDQLIVAGQSKLLDGSPIQL